MIQKYDGPIGKFEYDDTEFTFDSGGSLIYTGSETDGRYILIPEGIKDCSGMFNGYNILETMPVIPNGVTNCEFMFWDCTDLREISVLPDSILNCQGMFWGCNKLKTAPAIPPKTKNCISMFKDCCKLEFPPEIPNTVEECMFMFQNCKNLRTYIDPPKKANSNNMYQGCPSLIWAFLE